MSEATKKLKMACRSLYVQVPEEVADSVSAIADRVIDEAEKNQFFIDCLQSGGVGNWEWFEDSMEPYWEKYDE